MNDRKSIKTKEKSKNITYQRRLANYLKSFRFRNDLSPKDVASKLDYVLSRYYRLESDSIPYDRFINSIGFLTSLAELNNLTFSEFACYLDGVTEKTQDKNEKWKLKLNNIFENVNSKNLRGFLSVASTETKDDKEELETILNIYILLRKGSVKEETVRALLTMLQDIASKGPR